MISIKNSVVYFSLAIFMVSCNKPKEVIKTGKNNGLEVTTMSISLSNNYDDVIANNPNIDLWTYPEFTSRLSLDIDHDGIEDFEFYSELVLNPNSNHVYTSNSSLRIKNNDWSLIRDLSKAYKGNGELCFEDGVFGYQGTVPSVTYMAHFGCINSSCPENKTDFWTIEYLNSNEDISSNFNWSSEIQEYELYKEVKLVSYLTFFNSQNGDSLIGELLSFDFSCLNLPSNEEIYLPISKMADGNRYLGWIKVRLSGENTIEILETAIQDH